MALPNASLSLRVLVRLLSYPDAELRAHLPELRAGAACERAALPPIAAGRADALIGSAASRHRPRWRPKPSTCELFDRGRATSLHLFEHVHGDSRDRGPAMIDLAQTYEKAGLFLAPARNARLPAGGAGVRSTQPPEAGARLPGEMAHILNAIFSALQQAQQPYASVLGALLELAAKARRR
jgi:nitrate reductase delta subunit